MQKYGAVNIVTKVTSYTDGNIRPSMNLILQPFKEMLQMFL